MKFLARILICVILTATVVFTPSQLPGCGPFFAEAVFTKTRTPPLPDFCRGKLGVLLPGFEHKYLYVAYRYLSGQPFTEEELASLIASSNPTLNQSGHSSGESLDTAIKEWMDARSRIPGVGMVAEIRGFKSGQSMGEWRFFLNCREDAFRTATRTLNERVGTLGLDHPGVRDWITAQDAVFSNCSGQGSIPAAAEAQLPSVLKYDRAYQIAAAHFYSERYDIASEMFRSIAADSRSPWSALAPYLVARCLIRRATVPQKYGKSDRNLLMEAEQELHTILKDNDRAALHPTARGLLSYIQIRLRPMDRLRALAGRLERSGEQSDFAQSLTDYEYLMDHFDVESGFSIEAARQTSDMTDWILSLPAKDPAHTVERWRATGSTPWLVAAISQVHAGQPDAAALMDAVLKLPKHSPAFGTARYHRIRLLMESSKKDQARTELDELLPGLRASLPNSSLNLFIAQRMPVARNLDEFLEFAPRFPEAFLWDYFPYPELKKYGDGKIAMFDRDSVQVLNRGLPLSFLHRAAKGKLPPDLRDQLIRAAWTRAVLLSDNEVSGSLAAELERVSPDLGPDLKTWREARDNETKQFAAVMLLMHFPGMTPYLHSGVPARCTLEGIDRFRQNWWCDLDSTGDLESPVRYRNAGKDPAKPAEFPAFLGESDKAQFMQEWKKLKAIPTAPNYFGTVVLSWAAEHPVDVRVPQALYLVVKSTRYGCTDPETGSYSRSAFRLLHSKYPQTSWARSTPYWFK